MWHLLTMCSAHFRVAKYPIKPPFFWLCQELFLEFGFVKGGKKSNLLVGIVPILVFQGLTSLLFVIFAVFCLWHAASVLIN